MDKNANEEIRKYSGIYDEVMQIVGEENMLKFFDKFRGQQVVFPMKLYSRDYVVKVVSDEKGKKSISELAQEFGYSERYLRKLLESG